MSAPIDWLGCDAGPLYDPFREASLSEQQRRERKLAAAKAWLGERYLLHPNNRVNRRVHVTTKEAD